MAYDNTLGRLPDPTTTPAGPGFTAQTLVDNSTGVLHRLNTGATVGVKFAGNFWGINISIPELTPLESKSILPFLYSVGGGFKSFYVQLPTAINPASGLWDISTDTEIALGDISIVSSDTISIPAWSTRGGDLNVGDYIKFTNSNKVYLIVGDSLVSNIKTIVLNCDILEPLKMPTAGLEPNDIKFKVILEDNIAPQLTTRGVFDSFSLRLTENIL